MAIAERLMPSIRISLRGVLASGLPVLAAFLLIFFPASAGATPELWKSEGWTRTDFARTAIAWSEILSGGPPKDGIPSIDRPRFAAIAEATRMLELAGNEPVISLEIGGEARAYPLRILIWHEIVNDRIGDIPVAVTYCPLCNSSVVYDRRLDDRVLDFGTTGKLRNSDLVMYDRQTETWWQQFTGEALVGALLGKSLKLIPSRLEAFSEFRRRTPEGRVLIPSNPEARQYGRNPYVGYDSSKTPFLFNGELPQGIEAMARVVVARPDGGAITIVALEKLRASGRIEIDGLEMSWRPGQASALDAGLVKNGRDVGTVEVVRRAVAGSVTLVPYDVTFAFVAHAFHPGIAIIK